ncbi:MAG TPA: glycosyltransferase family 39 protein [Streptosporangiaceae bacterium]|nr:glycosyltransferase family 39 protein [Streptosporangiaceae bacterium]
MGHGTRTSRQAEPVEWATTAEGATAASHRKERAHGGWPLPSWWLLLAVLAVQAVLSLRLVKADTAFQDEALYLWAGHRELAHLLHGSPVPPFPTYFSGAPAIYPLFGALADNLGGLAAARILSLLFMLGTTGLLWAVARRLYGPTAAVFSAALFAVLGPTLHLGSFATYDAMSVFLVALSAWFVVRAGDRQDATSAMIAAGVTLALANATAYSIALFDPIVIGLALITAFPSPGGKRAVGRCLTLLTVVVVLLGIGLLIGGNYYRTGIASTTLQRVPGADPALRVFADSWAWTGAVAVVALTGVIISLTQRPRTARTWLLLLVTSAIVLVPAEQAGLHTTASLSKHGTMGSWFAAIAAGYAVNWFVSAAGVGRVRAVTVGACVAALMLPAVIGVGQARTFATDWPNSSSFTAILGPLVNHTSGRVLVEDPSIAAYYLSAGSQWQRWSGTRNIVLPSGASTGGPSKNAGVVGSGNAGVYAVFIQEGYFSLVALNFADTTALDHAIRAELRANHHYHIIDVVPYGPAHGTYVIWRYEPH